MQRRKFLQTATLAGAASVVPLSLAQAAALVAAPPRFVLACALVAEAGARFAAPDQAACDDCVASAVRIRLDGMHLAEGGAVLRELSLQAMFEQPLAPRAPFIACHYVAGEPPKHSQRMSFIAERASMRGFELEYRVADQESCQQEDCALTRFEAPLLAPGHYVLAGPRRNGSRVDATRLRHSGDPSAPLAGVRDFDYLSFRIEAIA